MKKEKLKEAMLLGSLGGQKTKERYGKHYFKEMAQKREAMKIERQAVLRSFTVGQLDDPEILKDVQDILETIDKQ